MEKEQEKLRQHLLQLRKELVHVKQLLQECRKGFKTISETGNIRVADVFLDELNDN